MARRDADWRECLVAAERKVKMAEYHLDCLKNEVARFSQRSNGVPIPIQAHFEGVLYCADAAADQILAALILRFELKDRFQRTLPNTLRLLRGVNDAIEPTIIAALAAWNEDPIVQDARLLRNRATHAHYTKTGDLEVQRVAPPQYSGSRGLAAYCAELVGHLKQLSPLLAQLEQLA